MPIEKEVKVKEYKSEVLVDFDGTKSMGGPKVLIQEDAYQGEILGAELIEVPAYNAPGQTEKKVVFTIRLSGDGSENAELPLYANPVVKKSGGKGYNNSKLYDLLEKSGELDAAKKSFEALETFEGLTGFFDAAFKGRKCKVLVKTRNKGTENAYSTIGDVVRFEPKEGAKAQAEAEAGALL